MSSPALDGITILSLGAAVGYLMTLRKTAETLVEKSVTEYRQQEKPPANKLNPSSKDIRDSFKDRPCPVEDANLADLNPKTVRLMQEARAEQQMSVQAFDQQSGGLQEPPPPVIQGVYLTQGE